MNGCWEKGSRLFFGSMAVIACPMLQWVAHIHEDAGSTNQVQRDIKNNALVPFLVRHNMLCNLGQQNLGNHV